MPELPAETVVGASPVARANAARAKYCSKRCRKKHDARVSGRKRESDFREALSKAERLAIAGAVAPGLRAKTSRRRITLVNAAGEPVREITDVELAQGILSRAGIELAVEPGVRPEHVICDVCLKPVPVDTSPPRKRHVECRHGRCADCNAPLRSHKTMAKAKKMGSVQRCGACSRRANGARLRQPCIDCGVEPRSTTTGRCVSCSAAARASACKKWSEAGLRARGVGCAQEEGPGTAIGVPQTTGRRIFPARTLETQIVRGANGS